MSEPKPQESIESTPVTEPEEEKLQEEEKEEDVTEQENCDEDKQNDMTETLESPELPQTKLSFLNPIDVSHLFQSPAPWMHVTEALPPPPAFPNYNRTPKLFSCSYESPYY